MLDRRQGAGRGRRARRDLRRHRGAARRRHRPVHGRRRRGGLEPHRLPARTTAAGPPGSPSPVSPPRPSARARTPPRRSSGCSTRPRGRRAEALGAMSVALNATTAYLNSRKQFGVTLNNFQALNFRAADMYVNLELTRSLVLWATMVLDAARGPGTPPGRGGRGPLLAAGRRRPVGVGQEAIQLHGGIGDDRGVLRRPPAQPAARPRAPPRRRAPPPGQLAARVASYGEVDPLP